MKLILASVKIMFCASVLLVSGFAYADGKCTDNPNLLECTGVGPNGFTGGSGSAGDPYVLPPGGPTSTRILGCEVTGLCNYAPDPYAGTGYAGSPSPAGSGNVGGPSIAEQQRQARCDATKQEQQRNNCDNVSKSAPINFSDLPAATRPSASDGPTWRQWGGTAIAFAASAYNATASAGVPNEVIAAGLINGAAACGSIAQCLSDLSKYYGQSTTNFPPFSIGAGFAGQSGASVNFTIPDIAAIINYFVPSTFANSRANKLAQNYINGQRCAELRQLLGADNCTK